jgi:hypothetical protein
MKCLSHHCKKEAETRGLCPFCYRAFGTVIKAGMLNWADIVKAGFALDAQQPKGRTKQLSDAQLTNVLLSAFPGGNIPSREAYIGAIGGRLSLISKRHRELLDASFPPIPLTKIENEEPDGEGEN